MTQSHLICRPLFRVLVAGMLLLGGSAWAAPQSTKPEYAEALAQHRAHLPKTEAPGKLAKHLTPDNKAGKQPNENHENKN